MSEGSEPLFTDETPEKKTSSDGLVGVNYRITPEAKQAILDLAKMHDVPHRVLVSHVFEVLGRDPHIISPPTKYPVQFELGSTPGSNGVTIATCEKCGEGYAPAENGKNIEEFLRWVEEHTHKKG